MICIIMVQLMPLLPQCLVFPISWRLTKVVLEEKRPLNGCLSVFNDIISMNS